MAMPHGDRFTVSKQREGVTMRKVLVLVAVAAALLIAVAVSSPASARVHDDGLATVTVR